MSRETRQLSDCERHEVEPEGELDASSAVLLVGTLNALADASATGFVGFEDFADDPERYEEHVIYDETNGMIVCDSYVREGHRDIVSYFDFPGAELSVVTDDVEPYAMCTVRGGDIIIEGGRWYVSLFR